MRRAAFLKRMAFALSATLFLDLDIDAPVMREDRYELTYEEMGLTDFGGQELYVRDYMQRFHATRRKGITYPLSGEASE